MLFKKLPAGVYRGFPKHKPDICNNDDTWALKYSLGKYFIMVYSFTHGNWRYIDGYSQAVLGITCPELQRVLMEKFNAKTKDFGDDFYTSYRCYFKNYEDAKKALEEFRPYYDSYYMPRAVMERLSFYSEGGYPPYFKDICDLEYDESKKYDIGENNNGR